MKTLVIAALAASCLVAPAFAQSVSVRVGVLTAGLDLATAEGRARLDRHIWRAAVAACGPVSSLDLAGSNAARRCAERSAAAARPQRDRLVAHAGAATIAGR